MDKAEKRRFPLEGLLNTRDLGGYPVVANGKQKTVKKGLLFRSGSPENITAADQKFLDSLNIRTTVDFRSDGEKSSVFNFPSLEKKVDLPIDAGNLMETFFETGEGLNNNSARKSEAKMIKLYSLLPVEAIPRYRVLFSLLADPASSPLLFYCSAGKDRTGMASALILHALGASRETITEDYFYSKENLRPYWERYANSQSYMIPYFTVAEDYLFAAFRAIEKYGGADRYLTDELGADINRLRDLYLE
ncbi:MAG: tyrosine-protein phosphatase [Treponema sp.]|nr:tyrosine-protein phosphatase [Treponema sp.]